MRISTLATALLISSSAILSPLSALAIPAKPESVVMTMPDGSQITVTVHGDENFHYYKSTEGHILVADADGYLCYATESGKRLTSSGVRAHRAELRTADEKAYLQAMNDATVRNIHSAISAQSESAARKPMAGGQFTDLFTAYPTLGSPRALVLLVEFPDQKFITPEPLSAFTDLMTLPGYNYNGATGSARDYFVENSRGLFTPEFDVYGPVMLPHDMAYYGRESGFLHDINPYQMVADACQLADDQIDFSIYDEDHDGLVDNVFVFYAGYGQNSGAPSHTIWPHAANIWTYGNIKLILDGVQIGNYACTNEIQGTEGSVRTGIGTFCHEFSHVLGLPDLYATDGSSSFTPGHFELMDVGPYLNNGNTPPFMSVYDRACLKWINPREINSGETVVLKSFLDKQSEADDEALLITTVSDNEYYLLENRQQSGWDAFIPGHGMLVWHIDFDASLWQNNAVNSVTKSQHLRVDIVEADGMATHNTWAGDPFPGSSNVTSFTDNTTPSMRTWTNVRVDKPLTNIREQDGVVSFDFMGGGERIEAVTALEASELSPLSFQANWTGRSEIVDYEIDLFNAEEVVPMRSVTVKTESLAECHVTFDGLTPSTNYSYVVRAVSGDRKSPNSNRVLVTTLAPTFDMLSPVALPASDVTGNSFTASWQPMEGADSYLLNVYTKSFNEPTHDVCDFSTGLDKLPEGWYTNSTSTSGMPGTFGAARPALRLSANNDLLRTPIYTVDINGLSFWVKTASSTTGRIVVKGNINNTWTDIAAFDAAQFTSAAQTIVIDSESAQIMPAGCSSLQIVFERTTGSVYLDDVTVAYNGATSMNNIEGYCNREVTGTSCNVTIPQPGTYFYSVTARSTDGRLSLPSNEIGVNTTLSSIGHLPADNGSMTVSASNGMITVTNRTDRPADYVIYSISGATLASGRVESSATVGSMPLLPGVYLIKAGDSVFKVII